mmetsp:Transcript_8798/g.19730  ORF Transcript_8798/g.19730 Transcript_8798/m.19730 type:complete len:81 (-) Transcript_8798:667-909(-)
MSLVIKSCSPSVLSSIPQQNPQYPIKTKIKMSQGRVVIHGILQHTNTQSPSFLRHKHQLLPSLFCPSAHYLATITDNECT